MPTIQYGQIFILLFQCLIVASLLLFLFRLRTVFGLGLLFTALGVFQYLQVFLAGTLYIEVAPGILVSPGSTVMFSGSLFAILLIYIREDAIEARKVIYAILAANLVLTFLQIVFSWNLEGDGVKNIYSLPKELFTQNARVLIVGTLVLFFDSFIVIILYEVISRYVSVLFLRILFSMAVVLSIDSLLFSFGAFGGTNQFLSILVSGLISKNSAALVYSVLFTIYLVYLDKDLHKKVVNAGSFKDIFYSLSFRQKYEHVFQEKEIQKIELQKSEDYNRLLFNTSPIGLALCRMDGSLIDVNPAFAKIIGRTIDETLKLTYWDITPEKYAAQEELQLKSLEETGRYESNEKEYIHKDGHLVPVRLHGLIIERKGVKFIWSSVEDITERKKTEEVLHYHRTLLAEMGKVAKIGGWEFDVATGKGTWTEETARIHDLDPNDETNMERGLSFYKDESRSKIVDAIKEAIEFGRSYKLELELITEKNIHKWVQTIGHPQIANGKVIHVRGSFQDITERKLAEVALSEAHEQYRQALTQAKAVPYLRYYHENHYNFIGDDIFKYTGYPAHEFLPSLWKELRQEVVMIGECAGLTIEEAGDQIREGKRSKWLADYKIRTKNGEIRWINDSSVQIKDQQGKIIGALGVLQDITERKKTEEEINKSRDELRSLSVHLQNIREEERTNLAREMHDEIGQILTSIKMNLSLMKRQVGNREKKFQREELDKEIKSMSEMVDHAVVRVRKMITELRPELLDKLGLIPALEWYVEEYEKETKIKCKFKSDFEELLLDHNVELTIFRIVQEALTNVTKHSKAKNVTVNIKKTETEIVVEIIDNGIGISKEKLKVEKSFGLLGMRERANLVGGKIEISGITGKGTTVKLVISN
ncbi:MAG: PAS domain S-box protein [Ignavibacteriaceae bacterium]|nr:PAS domain S-box protein [Ignavibacteriaceae bacterium]